ncbi:polysaccharide biosynthesis C-terminal domain-containing protein [Candidatus Uabimicrobium sp. HlEnr_7]|uniref:MATE family efflux transporter n=1 Tax=Candidatus Uabimicrobium helgolandensis TaxID=3095367 RepID=UPI00355788D3
MSKKDDFSIIGRGALIATLGILLQRISKFVIVMLQIKYLGLKQYGLFVICLSYILILGMIQSIGLRGLVKFCVQHRISKNSGSLWAIFLSSIFLPIITGTVISILSYIVISFLQLDLHTHQIFLCFLLLFPLFGSAEIPLLLTTSFETNAYLSLGRDIISPIVEIIGLAIVVLFDIPGGIFAIICIFAFRKFVMYTVAVYAFTTLCRLENIATHNLFDSLRIIRCHIKEIKEAVLYCLPLLYGNVFLKASQLLDVIILGAIVSNETTGAYQIAVYLANLVASAGAITLSMFSSIVSKHYQKRDLAAINIAYIHSIKLSVLLGFPAAIILFSFSENILSIFSTQAHIASFALKLLILGKSFHLLTGGVGMMLSMTDKAYLHTYNSFAASLIHILCCYIFIPWWSIDGAAFATIISLIFINILRVIQVYHFYNIHFVCQVTMYIVMLSFISIVITSSVKGFFTINIITIALFAISNYLFIWGACWYCIFDNEEKKNITKFR